MKRILLYGMLLILLPLRLMAQGEELTIIKGDCMPEIFNDGDSHRASRRLPKRKTDWDASKTYKQMVVLFSFSDQDFSENDPKAYYQKLFNETGFNDGLGPGCVADYYLAQSAGLVHFEFDIYGPVQVSSKAQPYEDPKPDDKTRNYGREPIKEATNLILEANPDVDYSQYDWDGDGRIEQVIYVYAGYSGNTGSAYGYIWPNTASFSTITTPDGMKISNYTASGEQWSPKTPRYCGLGTICHEFSHSLGLPDIYPVGNNLPHSAVDEWDLMDGGNFTNYGWCPPNFSPLEKMLLGWLTPIELTDAATITEMKPVEEGGSVYQIKHTDTEYLLLENRQWKGWDLGIPGKGLVVYSVNFEESAWTSNRVNSFSEESQFHYRIIHADNLTYDGWEDKIKEEKYPYQNSKRMNRTHLSTSPYPYQSNEELTNTSVPAAQMQTENEKGEILLSKPITNIQISDDGTVSFEFNEVAGINTVFQSVGDEKKGIYDLQGRLVQTPTSGQVYIIRKKDGTTRKQILVGAK